MDAENVVSGGRRQNVDGRHASQEDSRYTGTNSAVNITDKQHDLTNEVCG